jgi:hypothetical protein
MANFETKFGSKHSLYVNQKRMAQTKVEKEELLEMFLVKGQCRGKFLFLSANLCQRQTIRLHTFSLLAIQCTFAVWQIAID